MSFRVVLPAAVILLALAGCAPLAVESQTPVEVSPSAEPDYSTLSDEFGNGAWVAGVDVQPGVYLQIAEQPNCQWVTGVDGEVTGSGSGDVVLEAGEAIEVFGCSMFVKAD